MSDCCPRTNLDISSLFFALALSVGRSSEEVQQVASLVLQPKWSGGLEDVVARAVVGEGLKMLEAPWWRIGVEMGGLQPLVIWSASQPVEIQLENARKGWRDVVHFVRELGPTERAKIRGKKTPIRSKAPLDEDGRPLIRHQTPRKQVKVMERGSLRGGRPRTMPGGGRESHVAGPSQGIPNFSREEALGWFR